MSTVFVTFHTAGNRSVEKESMPVMRLTGAITEVVTASGASVRTATVSNGESAYASRDGGFVTIRAGTANLWVVTGKSADNPVAAKPAAGAAGPGFPVMANEAVSVGVDDGHKIAMIEWS